MYIQHTKTNFCQKIMCTLFTAEIDALKKELREIMDTKGISSPLAY